MSDLAALTGWSRQRQSARNEITAIDADAASTMATRTIVNVPARISPSVTAARPRWMAGNQRAPRSASQRAATSDDMMADGRKIASSATSAPGMPASR